MPTSHTRWQTCCAVRGTYNTVSPARRYALADEKAPTASHLLQQNKPQHQTVATHSQEQNHAIITHTSLHYIVQYYD
jgi:hypothetical protein